MSRLEPLGIGSTVVVRDPTRPRWDNEVGVIRATLPPNSKAPEAYIVFVAEWEIIIEPSKLELAEGGK